MILLFLFIAVPLIEIALFIQVGSLLGLWPTLAIVLVTAILGTALVRQQGFAVLQQVQGSFNDMRDPTEPLAHGAMILFSGALLITPGFFTDVVGFALLVPGIRKAAFTYLKKRIKVRNVHVSGGFQAGTGTGPQGSHPRDRQSRPDVIDADYTDLDKPDGPSGWTKR
jgi:UPF0716 protein FxsA